MTAERMWRTHDLRPSYDVVILGGGVHGLAVAYYLARRGITNVAVLDRGHLGAGVSGRDAALVRPPYHTPQGMALYDESLRLYERLAGELGYNVMFARQAHLTVAHTDRGVADLREQAETDRLLGVDSRMVTPLEMSRLVSGLNVSDRARRPILGGLYHRPGGVVRPDAVARGYARGADRLGVHLHPFTDITAIRTAGSRVEAVDTTRGPIATCTVVNATAGGCSAVARLVGIELPVVTHPLEFFVTEPLKPFLDAVVVSATLHVSITQTDSGEVVIDDAIGRYADHSQHSTLCFLENAAAHALELFPCLRRVKVLRQGTGLCDRTSDEAPILGPVEAVTGFLLDVGWDVSGLLAAPAAGFRLAELIATGQAPDVLRPFALARFADREPAGASVTDSPAASTP
jgi:sarcosine oxidase, subunit beta